MVTEGTYTGVIDRVEAGLAVILLEDDGDVVEELVVPLEELDVSVPDNDRLEGMVVTAEVRDDDLVSATADVEERTRRLERNQQRFDRLSRRPDEDRES